MLISGFAGSMSEHLFSFDVGGWLLTVYDSWLEESQSTDT
jgi:hypothetical protein